MEHKKRQVKEAQMDAEKSVQNKRREIREAEMETQIALEQRNQEWVKLASANAREQADAKAYGLAAAMQALSQADPKILQALTSVGMDPAQLMATAFRDLAAGAEKIGQLNISPDLLRELMQDQK